MAKIVKTNTQEMALKDITEKLKVVSAINPLFASQELNNVKVKITADAEEGKQVNTLVPIPFQLIAGGIKEYRKRLVSEIQSKAKTNAIILDDDDLAIINAGEKS